MNLEKNLIKKCVCHNEGSYAIFEQNKINDIDTLTCKYCLVTHQLLPNFTEQDLADFYARDYHVSYQQKKNVITYQDRYYHDCSVAQLRLDAYVDYIKEGMIGLDIGSSNSAFVHEANKRNIRCFGLEPGESIGDDTVTINDTLEHAEFEDESYNFVTMHDSIEHMIDPAASLDKVHRILMADGIAIIDLPDFYNPAGQHHWKTIEHLWFFSQDNFERLLKEHRFKVEKVTAPIPGKLVFYARVMK